MRDKDHHMGSFPCYTSGFVTFGAFLNVAPTCRTGGISTFLPANPMAAPPPLSHKMQSIAPPATNGVRLISHPMVRERKITPGLFLWLHSLYAHFSVAYPIPVIVFPFIRNLRLPFQ